MMASLALQTVAQELNAAFSVGQESQRQVCFSRVSTDTRSIQPGDVFVALRGDRFDAHNFLDEAVRKRACALVVEQHFAELAVPQLVVKDTTWALGQIARINRKLFTGPVIAITGSCGKTTVKTLVHNILAEQANVLATVGSLNNHIGVPLTLFQLSPEHRYAVIEMGASAPKEIDYLSRLVLPDVALVTNALMAHVEGFGSLDGVARSKGEVYLNLKDDGIAIANWDDPKKEIWLSQIGNRKTLCFGLAGSGAESVNRLKSASVDFIASDLVEHPNGTFEFILHLPDSHVGINLQLLGRHNVVNALAAAACAYSVGANVEDIKAGLEKSQAVSGRMQAHTGINGAIVIDDSYNANPDSVKAAINSLVNWRGKTILVLGDLGELGNDAAALHEELGSYAKTAGIQFVLATGKLTEGTCRKFGAGAQHFDSHQGIVERLQEIVDQDSVILIKGSRLAHMESVVAEIATDLDSNA